MNSLWRALESRWLLRFWIVDSDVLIWRRLKLKGWSVARGWQLPIPFGASEQRHQ